MVLGRVMRAEIVEDRDGDDGLDREDRDHPHDAAVGTIGAWIEAAEDLKPGTLMPNQHLSPTDLKDTMAYLEMLE
jgi:hypothetical protein